MAAPLKCVDCLHEHKENGTVVFHAVLVYDGNSLCEGHYDTRRENLLNTPPEVTT